MLLKRLCMVQGVHTLYNSDENVLLGAPTGSGTTISVELAVLHVFDANGMTNIRCPGIHSSSCHACIKLLKICRPTHHLQNIPLICLCMMQAFHTLYNSDENVLLGAPTGSGKTISAELAMLRVFNHYPGQKIIYIAPLKVCYYR